MARTWRASNCKQVQQAPAGTKSSAVCCAVLLQQLDIGQVQIAGLACGSHEIAQVALAR